MPVDDAHVSDEDLVRRVRQGDVSSAAILFDRHLPALRRAAHRRIPPLLRPKVGASDVVQDTYVAAFQSLDEFEDRGAGSFARWLRQILEHKILNEIQRNVGVQKRSAKREVRLGSGAARLLATPDERSAGSQVAAAEEEDAVHRALDDLPADYRAVIDLVHREGLTLAQAGARMGRSAEAARKLYARAVARLADSIGDA